MSGHTTRAPLLADTLNTLLPTDQHTLLLRACLLPDQAARDAWDRWIGAVGDAKQFLVNDRVGVKRHLPLLYENLGRAGAAISRELQPYFRTAHMREELRAQRYRRHCREAIAALTDRGVDFLLVKGAAISEVVYPSPTLRHCHDIDVLVGPQQVDRAVRALAGGGFSRVDAATRSHDLKISHESGLPIELHARMFACPFRPFSFDEVRARSSLVPIMDVPMRIMSPADTLVHLCGHAFGSHSRNTLAWVCDSCLLMRRHTDLDWSVVIGSAHRSRIELPLWVMLSYLSVHLDAPVPDGALEELRNGASRNSALLRDVALDTARTSLRGGLRNLLLASGWRSRLDVLRWMLLPTPAYLRWSCGEQHRWRVPLWYLLRPARFIRRRFKSRTTTPAARTEPDSPIYSTPR